MREKLDLCSLNFAEWRTMKRVAVVGAGSAGLCCARHLSRYPDKFQFSVFEQASEVGGTWVYEKREERPRDLRQGCRESEGSLPIHSSMYKNLR
jgi:cation diffusion facilitator CzcD-associated flavoprotein CzcO